LLEVIEDPFHDRRVLDASDDFHEAAALVTGLDVDLEHALEALGPQPVMTIRSAARRSGNAPAR